MSKLLKLKDMIQDLVDQGASTVEDIHKSIADMPFSALEKFKPLEPTVQSVKDVHDETVGGVYNLIRKINEEAGNLAEEILVRVEDAKDDEGENY